MLGPDGREAGESCTVWPSQVSADEAADLASDILGGAVIAVDPVTYSRSILGYQARLPIPCAWTLTVRAFIMEEAYEILRDTAPALLAGHLQEIHHPAVWRLQMGELVPHAWTADGCSLARIGLDRPRAVKPLGL